LICWSKCTSSGSSIVPRLSPTVRPWFIDFVLSHHIWMEAYTTVNFVIEISVSLM
jgi:hypothetical protein